MITQRIDELTYANIEDLVQRQVPEGRVLDYKRELPGRTDKDVKEFLADVSSFANASGGHLVCGITTKTQQGRNTNIPDQIVGLGQINVEQETLRLENVIRDGIDPRIVGLRVRAITEAGKATVVVIHVPRSWNAPHMIAKGSSKFYSRTSAGKQPLDVTEIRHAFAMSESIGERIRAFRDERIGKILAGETPVPIKPGALLVVHCIPLGAFTENAAMGLDALLAASTELRPLADGRMPITRRRNNLDGVLICTVERTDPEGSYIQVFRNGVIEAVDGLLFAAIVERRKGIIPGSFLEDRLIILCNQARQALSSMNVASPVVVFLSLLNVRGFGVEAPNRFASDFSLIDRQHLLLPDLLVDNVSTPAELFLRPAFDLIWQACGGTGSPFYDDKGMRQKPQ